MIACMPVYYHLWICFSLKDNLVLFEYKLISMLFKALYEPIFYLSFNTFSVSKCLAMANLCRFYSFTIALLQTNQAWYPWFIHQTFHFVPVTYPLLSFFSILTFFRWHLVSVFLPIVVRVNHDCKTPPYSKEAPNRKVKQ